MELTVTGDTTAVSHALLVTQKQMEFAVANAINATLVTIQARVRQHAQAAFTVRRPPFIMRQVAYIGRDDWAKVPTRPRRGRVSVGQKERLLLSTYEEGGERGPFTPGASHVAVPVLGSPARRTERSRVPKALTFEALAFRRDGGRIVGEKGTFIIPNVGVFMQTGKGRILLYAFVPRVKLPKSLAFIPTAQATTQQVYARYLRDELDAAADHTMRKGAKQAAASVMALGTAIAMMAQSKSKGVEMDDGGEGEN